MNPRTLIQRHRALRWLAPAAVVGVAGLVATGMFGIFNDSVAAPQTLPTTSPKSLLAGVRTASTTGMSGTVVSSLDLGLPELPLTVDIAGTGSPLTSLVSGSHTMRVWFGTEQQQRFALLGATDETDVFRNGRSLWEWSSATRTALHLKLPADAFGAPLGAGAAATTSPPAIASRTLADLDPATTVSVRPGGVVADRATYEMILTPHTRSTRVGSVRIAVDGVTKVPLAVRVYARGSRSPALDVAFTSVRFETPPARNFTFSPPSGATVHKLHMAGSSGGRQGSSSRSRLPAVPHTHVIGTGWSQIVAAKLPRTVVRTVQRSSVFQNLTPVAGTWGSGRLLHSDLVNALLTDDGHVYAGAVPPSALYAVAARG